MSTLTLFLATSSTVLAALLVRSYHAKSSSVSSLSEAPRPADRKLVDSLITEHANFPKQGVLFRDIFPVFRRPDALAALIRLLYQHIQTLGHVDVIVGLDSRGFLFGPILALLINASFVPVRKPGKLPGKVMSTSYSKEYGADGAEIQTDAIKPGDRVVIVDDLLATGGTLNAAEHLVRACQGNVVECVVIIELIELVGRNKVHSQVWSLYQY